MALSQKAVINLSNDTDFEKIQVLLSLHFGAVEQQHNTFPWFAPKSSPWDSVPQDTQILPASCVGPAATDAHAHPHSPRLLRMLPTAPKPSLETDTSSTPPRRSSSTDWAVSKLSFMVVMITPVGPLFTQPLQYRPAWAHSSQAQSCTWPRTLLDVGSRPVPALEVTASCRQWKNLPLLRGQSPLMVLSGICVPPDQHRAAKWAVSLQ